MSSKLAALRMRGPTGRVSLKLCTACQGREPLCLIPT